MVTNRTTYLRWGLRVAIAMAAALVILYGVFPVARYGIRVDSNLATAARLAGESSICISSSDLLLMVKDEKLTVARLTPDLVRHLDETTVKIDSTRDLPGALPIVLLFGVATAVFLRSRRDRRMDKSRALRLLWLLSLSCAIVLSYLWYWTGTADHNPLGAMADPLQSERWWGSFRDLRYWQYSNLVMLLVWLAGLLVYRRFLKDFFQSEKMPLIAGGFFVLCSASTVVMFRPSPYWEYAALSWWPMLLSLAVLSCNLAALYVIGLNQDSNRGGAQ